MKKRLFLITSLAAALTASAWWMLSPSDAEPSLVVPLSGVTIPAHRQDPAAKAQKLVSLDEAGRKELFRVGGRFDFSPVDGVSLMIETESVHPNEDGSLLSYGTVLGESRSVAVFSEVEGAVAGSVELADGRLFTINYVVSGVHRAAEVDFTTGLLDCGTCSDKRPEDLPPDMLVEYDDGPAQVTRRWLRGTRLAGPGGKRISSRKTVSVGVTGKNKKNGLQAQNKSGKSGKAQTGSKTNTSRQTGTNSKVQSGTKKTGNKNTTQSGTKTTGIKNKVTSQKNKKTSSKKKSGNGYGLNKSSKSKSKKTIGSQNKAIQRPSGSSGNVAARIDLMVVYTSGAAKKFGGEKGIKARINVAVSRSNKAFSDSGIKASLNLVHSGQVNYTSAGKKSTDLYNMSFRKTDLKKQVAGLRKKYKADLVTLVTEKDGGGVGFLLNRKSPMPHIGFNVVCANSLYYAVLAHECGHNLGCQHAKGDPGSGKSMDDYGYGWRFYASDGKRTRQHRTIMAYAPGSRIGYFSNPNVKYNGVPTGAGGANNAAVINKTAGIVARNSD